MLKKLSDSESQIKLKRSVIKLTGELYHHLPVSSSVIELLLSIGPYLMSEKGDDDVTVMQNADISEKGNYVVDLETQSPICKIC